MMQRTRYLRRRATDWIVLIACSLLPVIAAGQPGPSSQSEDSKPPPVAKDQAKPDAKPGKSRTAPAGARERPRSGERIRLDAPVSFPVDI
jgi:hypothetical protein